jgi:tetratricopeptide (TPR) repeat protein
MESYEKAVMIFRRAFGEDHPKLAMYFNNMGIVYQMEKKYSEAFECYRKALTIWEKHLPAHFSLLGQSHNNIGEIHHAPS